MSIDLGSFKLRERAQKGFRFEVLHPVTHEPTGAVIFLQGRDAPAVVEVENRQQRERARREMRASGAMMDNLERESVERAVAATLGWEGVDYDGQSPYPFSPENARALYTAEAHWLLYPVLAAVNDRERLDRD